MNYALVDEYGQMTSTPCTVDDVYLRCAGEEWDLHNCFDLVGFTYELQSRALILEWKPNEYGPDDETRTLRVTFSGVSHLSMTARDLQMPFTEDTCLQGAQRLPPASPIEEAGLYAEPGADWDYLVDFMSGFGIRVGCAQLTLTTS